MTRLALVWSSLIICAGAARAEPRFIIKMASSAPEGSMFDRELRTFSHEVESATDGAVKIKWYQGGIVGNELEVHDRILKGHIDGGASSGPLCEREAPSIRIFNFPGLFQDRDETTYVANRLKPIFKEEFQRSGITLLELSGLGPGVIFSRRPIAALLELKATRLWTWSLLSTTIESLTALGFHPVPLDLPDAARAYEDERIDGFIAIPTGALAFQWSSQTRYITDLPIVFVMGCLVISNRSFDRLPIDYQGAMHAAAAKLAVRLQDIERRQDDMLLGGSFERQGLKPVAVSETFRSQFLDGARSTRNQLAVKLGMQPLLENVLSILADYRAEHSRAPKR